MKHRMIKLLIAAFLILMLPVSLLLCGETLPSYYGDTYYGELSAMYERLNSVEGPKIVVVGGSNVAFGLDGALLEELLAQQGYSYTVCPFGLYAAVGTSAMLDLSRDALREGDIVVLAIEPTSETMSTYFGAGAFWKCAEDSPNLLLEVSRDKQAALFGNYISYLQERYSIYRSGDVPAADGVYARSSFSQRCDMIFLRAGNAMPVGYDTGSPIDLSTVTITEDFALQVNEYCAAAAAKGASVVMSFSPVNRSALTDPSADPVASYFDRCNQTFSCPMISDPNTYILDSGWFYDSNFHLNSAGAELRTCLLAEDLLAYLGCCRELEYTLPGMPGSIARVEENDANGDCFTFTPIAGGAGYRISGLTAEGLSRESLAVPSSYEGKPVVGFTSDALSGAERIVELRLPGSIESLPDGLFRDCASLTRLILEHTVTVCDVSEHTFAGADQIRIYVPDGVYTMYRDGAGCEANPWTEYLDRIYTY